MITKTQQMLGHLSSGEIKEALRIAKDFKIGMSKEDRKVLSRGYECLVHPKFYEQMGVECDKAIASAVHLLYIKYEQKEVTA